MGQEIVVDIISMAFPLMVEDICSTMFMGTSLKFQESMFLSSLWAVGLMALSGKYQEYFLCFLEFNHRFTGESKFFG